MTPRDLLDIAADYVEARAAERERLAQFPASSPVADLDALAAKWEAAVVEVLGSRP